MSSVGLTGKPHGFKGYLKVETSVSLKFMDFVFISFDECPVPFRIKSLNEKAGTILFDDISSETEAKMLMRKEIWVMKKDLPKDFDFTTTGDDMMGYKCFNKNKFIGNVIAIVDLAKQDLMKIKGPNGEEFLVPFVEQFLVEKDIQDKCIYFELPEGLLQINH